LKDLPDETVIDGELVALGPDGRPDFNLLQNFRSAESRIVYYPFDILIYKQRNLTQLPLSERRAILSNAIEPREHVAVSEVSDRSAAEMLRFIKSHGVAFGIIWRSVSELFGVRCLTCESWAKYLRKLGSLRCPGFG
jgi:ATP-dependent DNA ligase